MRFLPLLLVLAMAAAHVAPSVAQQPLRRGDRIRFTTTAEPGTPVEATIKAIGDTLILESADQVRTTATGAPARRTMAVSRGDLVSLEIQRSGRSHALKGALIGGGIGAALGLGIGTLATTETNGWGYTVNGSDIVTAALVLGGVGAVIGAIAGSGSHEHSWEPVQLTRLAPEVRINPVGASMSLGIRVRF